ncbi:MAG: nucleoside phosphorylase [Anaerolineae bacterium]
MRQKYPILEYDPTRRAVVEPSEQIEPAGIPETCLICFFQEVLMNLANQGRLEQITSSKSEIGEHPFYGLAFQDQELTVFHPGIGAPLGVGLLEEAIAKGCRKFIACGGAGVLKREITAGHLVVPISAVRDEGTSYHYLPPSREVQPSKEAIEVIERVLERHHVPYVAGKTWTTDAFYRETPDKVALRREEGCLTVEMEAAAFFAVAQFRGVTFGQILYGGDDVSGDTWDTRYWNELSSDREKLFWLAAEACLELGGQER